MAKVLTIAAGGIGPSKQLSNYRVNSAMVVELRRWTARRLRRWAIWRLVVLDKSELRGGDLVDVTRWGSAVQRKYACMAGQSRPTEPRCMALTLAASGYVSTLWSFPQRPSPKTDRPGPARRSQRRRAQQCSIAILNQALHPTPSPVF